MKSLEIFEFHKDNIFRNFLRNYNRFLFFENKINNFFILYKDESFKAWKRQKKNRNNIIKDIRNLFRLKKEIDYSTTKGIWNLFRLRK